MRKALFAFAFFSLLAVSIGVFKHNIKEAEASPLAVIAQNYKQAQGEPTPQLVSDTTQPAAEPEAKPAEAPAAPQPIVVEVQPGDILSKIAEDHGTTYQRLFNANVEIINPDLILPGQKIRIPFPDEVIAERELPTPVPAPAAVPSYNTPAPTNQPVVSSAPAVDSGSVWDQLAKCESGGNWAINTGNGYYGGVQFSLSTWRGVGGSGLPSENSREEQIKRAEILLARSGWGQWPACSAKLGLR